MGRGHNGTEAQWDGGSVELGTVGLGQIWMLTQWDWGTVGNGLHGTGAQCDGGKMELGHNGKGVQWNGDAVARWHNWTRAH